MKKLSKIKLNQLGRDDMNDREMNMLRGGNNCGCDCGTLEYATTWSKSSSYEVSWTGSDSGDSGNDVCSWEGTGCVYGGSTIPSK